MFVHSNVKPLKKENQQYNLCKKDYEPHHHLTTTDH